MLLFHNHRDGTFEDVSQSAGRNMPLESRRGAAFGDINNDGNIDIVVFTRRRAAIATAESQTAARITAYCSSW